MRPRIGKKPLITPTFCRKSLLFQWISFQKPQKSAIRDVQLRESESTGVDATPGFSRVGVGIDSTGSGVGVGGKPPQRRKPAPNAKIVSERCYFWFSIAYMSKIKCNLSIILTSRAKLFVRFVAFSESFLTESSLESIPRSRLHFRLRS